MNQNESAIEELATFEKEKVSRRNALGRLGFLAGAAAVASLTSDDLLRKVGDTLSQYAGDNKVAKEVAKEFQAAGVAFANPSGGWCTGCHSNCTPNAGFTCENCLLICGANTQKLVPSTCSEKPRQPSCIACCDAQYDACKAKCAPGSAGNQCILNCNTAYSTCIGYVNPPSGCMALPE